MIVTNKLDLPEVLVRALQRDPYSRGSSRYSVTQLIDAVRPRVLKEQHAEEISRDISDSVWMLLGKGVHHILEHGAAAEGDTDHTIEERIFVNVRGIEVSGAMDVQRHPGGEAEIIDWKVTSTYRVSSAPGLKKWEEQLNLYRIFRVMIKDLILSGKALLWRDENGIIRPHHTFAPPEFAEEFYPGEVTKLTIVAFLRDWSKSKARQNPDYPQAPVIKIPLPVWSIADAHAYLHDRVKAHQDGDSLADVGMIPQCSDEDRWKRGGSFEVVQITKDGREWVRNKFEGEGAKEKAEEQMAKNIAAMKNEAKTWVREQVGVPTRCMDWCEAAPFCEQWAKDPDNPANK